MEGVKRCIVLFLFDRTCEHEQARRARFWTEKEYLAERKSCQSYVREDFIAALDFHIGREPSSVRSEKSFWRGIKVRC